MSTGRLGAGDTAIQPTIFDAKADILTATAADTPARLAVGSNGQYLKADSTTATGLAWATLPASGKVLQVVQATYGTQTSNSTYTLSDTGLSATITPTSTSSKILILAHHNGVSKSNANAGNAVQIELYRGTSTSLVTVFAGYTGTALRVDIGTNAITYLDSPSTTSATTYKTRFKNGGVDGPSATVQQDGALSTMTLLEIGA